MIKRSVFLNEPPAAPGRWLSRLPSITKEGSLLVPVVGDLFMNFSMTSGELGAGVAVDLLIGDPRWLPHPVRGIAKMVQLDRKSVV